jgi:hypothetical protein
MINKIVIAFTLIFLFGCKSKIEEQNELFQEDSKFILEEVQKMNNDDQNIRYFGMYGTIDSQQIEQIQLEYAKQGINIDSVLSSTDTTLLNQHEFDLIKNVMIVYQLKHTKRIIELIEKYGYPSNRRIVGNNISIDPQIIIQHADFDSSRILLSLLEQEFEAKRIDKGQFEFMKWHLNGRVGIPQIPGVEVIRINKDGTSDTMITK